MSVERNDGFSCLLPKVILCLTVRNMKSLVYNIFDDVNKTKFPGFSKGILLECTQELNDSIFVPSGWYHQVHNLEDTISINHNWFNANNLCWVWDLLPKDNSEAKEYIEDIKDICDDIEGLCQPNLAANTGMNFSDFLLFLARFSFANLILLHYLSKKNGTQILNLSPIAQHFIFNLVSTQKIAFSMNSVEDLTGFHGFYMDFRETINDPGFIKLSIALGQTYGMIHTQHSQNFDKEAGIDNMKDLDFLGTCNSQVRTPMDLLNFMEHAVAEFSGV